MGGHYVDHALPFGSRSAPKMFLAVADVITWVLHCSGVKHQIHYLNDFLFIGTPNTEERDTLVTALRVLGPGSNEQDNMPGLPWNSFCSLEPPIRRKETP